MIRNQLKGTYLNLFLYNLRYCYHYSYCCTLALASFVEEIIFWGHNVWLSFNKLLFPPGRSKGSRINRKLDRRTSNRHYPSVYLDRTMKKNIEMTWNRVMWSRHGIVVDKLWKNLGKWNWKYRTRVSKVLIVLQHCPASYPGYRHFPLLKPSLWKYIILILIWTVWYLFKKCSDQITCRLLPLAHFNTE